MITKELTVREFISDNAIDMNSKNYKYIDFLDLRDAHSSYVRFEFSDESKYSDYLDMLVADVLFHRHDDINESVVEFKCFSGCKEHYPRKYILTNDTIEYNGETLYRIRSVSHFRCHYLRYVRVGDFGGYVSDLSRLSQDGTCWVADNAKVICGIVSENAIVGGNAVIVSGAVHGNADVYCGAYVCGDGVEICGQSDIYGIVRDRAKVRGYSTIHEYSEISGSEFVCDSKSYVPLFNNIRESLRCQLGIIPIGDKVIAYKLVNNDLTSMYDNDFKYVVGEYAIAENPDMSNMACSNGLHFSTATYYDEKITYNARTILVAEIELNDIITVQAGKIRCKRAKILDSYVIPMTTEEENEK